MKERGSDGGRDENQKIDENYFLKLGNDKYNNKKYFLALNVPL